MWTRFLTLLRERGIKDSSARWHDFRAEQIPDLMLTSQIDAAPA
jgi:hypothetical protein